MKTIISILFALSLSFSVKGQDYEIAQFEYYLGDSLKNIQTDTFSINNRIRLIEDFNISKKSIDSVILLIENSEKYYMLIGDSINPNSVPNDSIVLIMNSSEFNIFKTKHADLAYMGDKYFKFQKELIHIFWFSVDNKNDWAEDKAHYFIYSKEYGVLKSKIPNFFSIPEYCLKIKKWDKNENSWINLYKLNKKINNYNR